MAPSIVKYSFCHPIFCPVSLPPLDQVFPVEAWRIAAPPVAVAASAAAEPPGIAAGIAAAEPPGIAVGISVAEPLGRVVAWPPPGIAVGIAAAEPPGIAVLTGILIGPLSTAVAIGVSNPGHPRFAAFPNDCSFSSCSSSVQLVGEGSAGSSMDVLPNDALCSHSSNLSVPLNKRMGPFGSSASPSHSAVTDTSALPTVATTIHRRKRCPHPCRGRHRHTSRGSLPSLVVRKIR